MSLNELAQKINETSTSHGFWPTHEQELEDIEMLLESAKDGTSVWNGIEAAAERLRSKLASKEARNMGEMLMLAVSELAEALEEHRDGKPVHYYSINIKPGQALPVEAKPILDKLRDNLEAEGLGSKEAIHLITKEEERRLAELGVAKPEGLAVELADCIIRCLDTMHSLGVDIDQIVQEKMAYNNSRPHKHGKAY